MMLNILLAPSLSRVMANFKTNANSILAVVARTRLAYKLCAGGLALSAAVFVVSALRRRSQQHAAQAQAADDSVDFVDPQAAQFAHMAHRIGAEIGALRKSIEFFGAASSPVATPTNGNTSGGDKPKKHNTEKRNKSRILIDEKITKLLITIDGVTCGGDTAMEQRGRRKLWAAEVNDLANMFHGFVDTPEPEGNQEQE